MLPNESGASSAVVTVRGRVIDFAPGSAAGAAPTPLEGVKVCALGHPEVPCTTSDAAGRYALPNVPASARGAVTFEMADYVGSIYPGDTTVDRVVEASLPSNTVATIFSQLVGGTFPFGETGVILGEPSAPRLPDAGADGGTVLVPQDGVSIAIAPASGEGPFYANDVGVPDKTLSATTHGDWGGGYTNATPGNVDVTFSHAAMDCSEITLGWPSTKARSLQAPIQAGFVTIVGVRCH